MRFIEIQDKKIWNEFIASQKFSQFLQSWEWGEFHKKMGRRVWRFALINTNGREKEHELTRNTNANGCECERLPAPLSRESARNLFNGEIVIAAQAIKYDLPLGQSYLYCPRGAVFKLQTSNFKFQKDSMEEIGFEAVNLFVEKLKEFARKEGSMFLRVEPREELKVIEFPPKADSQPEAGVAFLAKNVYKVKSVQPENEWMLDLEKTEEELFKEMRQKTRYNIRLAEKKGVRIFCLPRKAESATDETDKFWELISSTYGRKEIKTHSRKYYEGILEIGNFNDNAETRQCLVSAVDARTELWRAEHGGKIIAANILSYFGDTATYMHGGADYNARNLMAPYLLQWTAIKDAKKRGYKFYNFGGVKSEKKNALAGISQKSDWAGITRFKKWFGGFEVNYAGTYDMPINNLKYWVYKIAKSFG